MESTEAKVTETLEERYLKFQRLELPGQPLMMHMGTSYLMQDMWAEIVRLRELCDRK